MDHVDQEPDCSRNVNYLAAERSHNLLQAALAGDDTEAYSKHISTARELHSEIYRQRKIEGRRNFHISKRDHFLKMSYEHPDQSVMFEEIADKHSELAFNCYIELMMCQHQK